MCDFYVIIKLMGILDIDYDNLVVNKFLIVDRMGFQIDNFYKYPNLVAALFHKHKNKSRTAESNYPGKLLFMSDVEDVIGRTLFCEHLDELKNILAENGGDHSKFVQGEKHDNGNFSLYHEDVRSEKNQESCLLPIGQKFDPICNPHTDPHPETGTDMIYTSTICCLSKECHGGTGIYYNKHLKTYTGLTNYETVKGVFPKLKTSHDRPSEELDSIVESHIKDIVSKGSPRQSHEGCMNDTDEHFELLHFFPMKFNRMIVFDGDMLHSMYAKDKSFFDTHERLTMNYFMSARKPQEHQPDYNTEQCVLEKLVRDVAQRRPYVNTFLKLFLKIDVRRDAPQTKDIFKK